MNTEVLMDKAFLRNYVINNMRNHRIVAVADEYAKDDLKVTFTDDVNFCEEVEKAFTKLSECDGKLCHLSYQYYNEEDDDYFMHTVQFAFTYNLPSCFVKRMLNLHNKGKIIIAVRNYNDATREDRKAFKEFIKSTRMYL